MNQSVWVQRLKGLLRRDVTKVTKNGPTTGLREDLERKMQMKTPTDGDFYVAVIELVLAIAKIVKILFG